MKQSWTHNKENKVGRDGFAFNTLINKQASGF
jgi:hypothetical protein